MASRLGLRTRFALLIAALALCGLAFVGIGLWVGYTRGGGSTEGFAIAAVISLFGLIGLASLTWYLFDENVARPILALTAGMRTRAVASAPGEDDSQVAGYLAELVDASHAMDAALEDARVSLEQALAEKTAQIERDKALLEALLRELADGVVVVSPERRILLYNRVAATLLSSLGLDRPLERCLRIDPVNAAIERQAANDSIANSAVFLTSSIDGNLMLTGTVSAVDLGENRAGYVLHFRDMTEDLRVHGELERLLRRTIEGARRPASAMGAVLDVFEAVPGMAPGDRANLDASLREELALLTGMLEDSSAMEQKLSAAHWPIRALDVQQVFDALVVRVEGQIESVHSDAVALCDGYAVTETLNHIARALLARTGREGLTLSAEITGGEVRLYLAWRGPTLSLGELEGWLSQPVATAYGDYTGRDALTAHRSDIWVEPVEKGARIVLPLPAVEDAQERLHIPGLLRFYDFGLPTYADPDLGPRPLSDLAFTVFDTETTGLDPGRDVVVQISGVRIVGGRLMHEETFDLLVNPGRPIPPSSTEIHGISDAMVADAPPFDTVADAFLQFAEGSVLVAHHAAFDMAFLHRHKRDADQKLSIPVLCTALLSSRLFSHSGDHTLDGLAARCGVEIDAALRHTALGDSLATAKVFLKLIPLLETEGIHSLDESLTWQSGRRR